MAISFVHPTEIAEYIEFFKNGRRFIGYTGEGSQVEFYVVNDKTFTCQILGLEIQCTFDPLSWMLFVEDDIICQLDEIIPTNHFI